MTNTTILNPLEELRKENNITLALNDEPSAPQEESGGCRCKIGILPFEHCKRPIDELRTVCSSKSECGGFVRAVTREDETVESGSDKLWAIFQLTGEGAESTKLMVIMDVFLLPPEGCADNPVQIPGMSSIPVPPRIVGGDDPPALHDTTYECPSKKKFIAEVNLGQMIPSMGNWNWDELDNSARSRIRDEEDLFSFCSLFEQRLLIRLRLFCGEKNISQDEIIVDVFDHTRIGSLFQIVTEILVNQDSQTQGVDPRYHPWYPVLKIGASKFREYMRLAARDFKLQKKNFGNPCWLVKVGKYLDILTSLGIIEAVKIAYPNLLTPEQRDCLENGCQYDRIRPLLKTTEWQTLWNQTRAVSSLPGSSTFAAGNMLRKKTAVLSFMELHHEDLKNALVLAGANKECGCTTWKRVFRLAELATIKHTGAGADSAFPEIMGASGPSPIRGMILSEASERYKKSLNAVAEFAKNKGLMDYSGTECISKADSLMQGDNLQVIELMSNDARENSCEK